MFGTLRKRKQVIYLFITAAMILGMGFFGMGTAMQTMNSRSGAVATVDGQPIMAAELEERVDSQRRRVRQMLGDQADAFMQQLNLEGRALEEVIDEKVSLVEAKRLQITVPDAELVDFIANSPNFQKDGKFDVDSYEKIPNRGAMEARIRDDLANNKFHEYVYERIRLTPTELRNSFLLKETKADVQYARINLVELGSKAKPSTEQLKAALADGPALEAYYQEKKSEYAVPASAQYRQIRVGIPFQASAAQKDQAKKRINEIAGELNASNFNEVAKAKSDDEYAKKGGEVGWTDLKNVDKQVKEALLKLDPGQVSQVVETNFAFYLLKVEQKKPETQKSLEEVKSVVAEKVATRKAAESFAAQKQKEWEKLLAEGKSLDSELKKAGIELKKSGPFSLGQGYLPNVGKADEIVDAIFTLTPQSPVYPKLVGFQGDYFYVKLLTLDRAKEAEFTKNPDTFEKSLSSSLQTELYKDWMEEAKKRTKIVSLVKTAPVAETVEN